jgi:hypothetical protein
MPLKKKAKPQNRGHKTAGIASAVWPVLVKTGWLPIAALNLSLPRDFFYDEYIAGLMGVWIGWFIREVREFIANPTILKR